MGNEFKDFEMETPSLTLEPDLGEFEKKEEILKKEEELVVQKDRLQNVGNSGYCLCFPYSVKECEWYYAGGEA